MVTKRLRRMVSVWACCCERCGHTWDAVGDGPPTACARCKSRAWNTPPGTLKPGPKPKRR